jgi:hypothetical protein
MHIVFSFENLEGIDYLEEDIGVDGKKKLKWIFGK